MTQGGGGTATVTQVIVSYVQPSSTSSSFTCRTYATNYLNGYHGRKIKRRSVFDIEVVLSEEDRVPRPASRPSLEQSVQSGMPEFDVAGMVVE